MWFVYTLLCNRLSFRVEHGAHWVKDEIALKVLTLNPWQRNLMGWRETRPAGSIWRHLLLLTTLLYFTLQLHTTTYYRFHMATLTYNNEPPASLPAIAWSWIFLLKCLVNEQWSCCEYLNNGGGVTMLSIGRRGLPAGRLCSFLWTKSWLRFDDKYKFTRSLRVCLAPTSSLWACFTSGSSIPVEWG